MSGTVGRVLYSTVAQANGHAHALRVLEVQFPDSVEVFVEVSEPNKCGCARMMPLSEMAHLILNVSDHELLVIPNRSEDQAGHAHA